MILAIGGRQPTSGAHATRILSSYQSGEKITLRIIRQHKTLDVETTLPERASQHETRWRDARSAAQDRDRQVVSVDDTQT